ncbi:XAC2610-related protein [Pedobacter nototheniae]|uniref:XAC2610-related protein n=1 Tax=Pedobacter nototheniae TaxID=2488994 RepID=UPI00292DC8E7|nr:hypothetical protein [Pedobacter nototheniae]
MIKPLLIISLILITSFANAQPFNLKSVGEPKAFGLKIYFGTAGKGAFVQYNGQKGIIPLQVKSYMFDTAGRRNNKPDVAVYQWDEIINGQITGNYGLTIKQDEASAIWYLRKKDGKRFLFTSVKEKTENLDGKDKYLLHGALLSFNHSNDDLLNINYSNQTKKALTLPGFDNPNYTRRSIIADYNFDGYDDIAFSIPDAGMGVYHTFSILLYHSKTKQFVKLQEPDYAKSNCSCLCDISIDSKKKLLYSACRGAASWWKDTYRFNGENKLVLVK